MIKRIDLEVREVVISIDGDEFFIPFDSLEQLDIHVGQAKRMVRAAEMEHVQ